MRIFSRAVERYIDRVLNIEQDQAGEKTKRFATEQIVLTVNKPDIIYDKDPEREPVHIRNGCAVPVYRKEDPEETYVPTAYRAGTFLKKIKTHESRKPVRQEA